MKEPENLHQWKCRDYLTVDEAVCLALGEEPSNYTHDHLLATEAPEIYASYDSIEGFNLLSSGLQNAIEAKGIPTIMTGNVGDAYREEKISVADLIPWLEKHNIDAPFFIHENPAPKPTKRPEYQTHMMKVMYDVIERYYGENYDPDNRDSVTSGPVVQKWLVENYERSDGSGKPLSGVEASAIDAMTRPDQIRHRKTKKC